MFCFCCLDNFMGVVTVVGDSFVVVLGVTVSPSRKSTVEIRPVYEIHLLIHHEEVLDEDERHHLLQESVGLADQLHQKQQYLALHRYNQHRRRPA